jgi:hypothetical protein
MAGLVGNFTFGALMNLGIGAYAPSLILFGSWAWISRPSSRS